MSIYEYAQKYGNYTFDKMEFNEVDNVILSILSYVNYNDIVSNNSKNKITLNDVSSKYFKIHDDKFNKLQILAVRGAIDLLKKISNLKRYKDILMYNYKYIGNETSQFSAITFELTDSLCYIAFEGTDQLISGWKEDCKMAYLFPVDAHRYAYKYLNNHFTFNKKKLIVGGHSKGGNLALVASMLCNFYVKKKIVNIYSNDGQGLRIKEIESKKYIKIQSRYIHIIPQYSIVGLLLNNTDNHTVIHSKKLGILSHDATTWIVEDNHLKYDTLSNSSIVFNKGFNKWLNKYNDNEKKLFVENIFKILEENNITTLIQLKQNKKLIFEILKSTKNINDVVKNMIKELFIIVNKTNLESLLS